ncbi:MAG: DUF4124 domain-containing protein [Methylobacillus sp.]|nr:DUF4124 domain-containing protein [Methylobacillus sp.]
MLRRSHLPTNVMAYLLLTLNTSTIWAATESKQPSGKIMKWVDEQGITHYGDTLPPQYSGKESSISPRGLPQTDAGNSTPSEPPGKESEQARRDRTLQAIYSSEHEIDRARDRNLEMDQAMLEGLEQRKLSVTARLQALKNTETGYSKRGQPLPKEFKKDVKSTLLEIGKIDEQIAERKHHMETMRSRFEADKKRFIELKTGVPAGEGTSTAH